MWWEWYLTIINSNLEIIIEESFLQLSTAPISQDNTQHSTKQCLISCPKLHSCSGTAQIHHNKLCIHWRPNSCRNSEELSHILHCSNCILRNNLYIVHWRYRRLCSMEILLRKLRCSCTSKDCISDKHQCPSSIQHIQHQILPCQQLCRRLQCQHSRRILCSKSNIVRCCCRRFCREGQLEHKLHLRWRTRIPSMSCRPGWPSPSWRNRRQLGGWRLMGPTHKLRCWRRIRRSNLCIEDLRLFCKDLRPAGRHCWRRKPRGLSRLCRLRFTKFCSRDLRERRCWRVRIHNFHWRGRILGSSSSTVRLRHHDSCRDRRRAGRRC